MLSFRSEARSRGVVMLAALVLGVGGGSGLLAADLAASPAAVPAAEYHPSMGDLMTMAIQPRHIKLGLAGKAGNWTYATYELSELRNAFARIGRTIPVYRNTDTAALLSAMTQGPLDALEASVKAKDRAQFTRAYAAMTAVCNACHVSQDHAMVVIQEPSGRSFADQNFQPSAAR